MEKLGVLVRDIDSPTQLKTRSTDSQETAAERLQWLNKVASVHIAFCCQQRFSLCPFEHYMFGCAL